MATRAVCSSLQKRILKNAREMYDAAPVNGRTAREWQRIVGTLTDYTKHFSSAISLSFKCGSLIDQLLVAPQRHADFAADLLDVAEETSHVLVRFNRMEESLLANYY